MPLTVTPPPEQFDHPYRGGPLVEYRLPLEQAREMCGAMGYELIVDDCSAIRIKDNTCVIVVPVDGPDPVIAHYERHEIAHCNGWRADHASE